MTQLPTFKPAAEIKEQRTLRHDYERLRAIAQFTQFVNSDPTSVEHVSSSLIDHVFDLVRPDRVGLWLKHAPVDDLSRYQLKFIRTRESFSDQIVLPDDVIDEALAQQWGALRRSPQSFIATPIYFESECHGILAAQADRPDAFRPKDQLACVHMSGLYGLVIRAAQLATAVQAYREEAPK